MADFNPIRVSELPEVTNVGENDYLVVDDGIQTSKIKSKNYNERSSRSAKEYADEATRSASRATERAEAAAQSVIQVDALAQNASASANTALDYSRDAEAWAKGTRDGSAVPITDATHENNAKYFAQQAQNSATSAAESADAAEELLVSAIDSTLTQAGKAADAKKTGDELANLSSAIEQIEPGLSEEAKAALLNCLRHMAWENNQGQIYYDALEAALYPDVYPKIVVTINQTGEIFDTDALDVVRQYLTVTYFDTAESQGAVVTGYTLEGNLVIGTSQITVRYNGLRATVSVTVTAFHYDPVFAYGAPYANTSVFRYTPNQIRACMNPIAAKLPAGTYVFEYTAGTDYYFSTGVIKFDESQYSPDFSFTEGTEKTFMTEGMTYAYPAYADGSNGWQQTTKTFVVTEEYTRIFLNFKKGFAGTSQFTSADIAALNGHMVFRRVS